MKSSILTILDMALDRFIQDLKQIKPGHNGPYKDEETFVRVYSHWLVISSYLYFNTTDEKYKTFSYELINALKSSNARPMGAAFFCRKNPQKDFSNGLMGQAWVMEALVYASKIFDDVSLMNLAVDLYEMHYFDTNCSLWRVLNVDGSYNDFDQTFNHQLWFAAIASKLNSDRAKEDSKSFVNNILMNVELYQNGVIYHKSMLFKFNVEAKNGISAVISYLLNKLYSLRLKKSLYLKSVGYHGFNLVALCHLYSQFPNHKFFSSEKFKKIIGVIKSDKYISELVKSKYSYQYNPPGIEEAIALTNFDAYLDINAAKIALFRHFSITGLSNSDVSDDFNTSLSRLYELTLINWDCNVEFDVGGEDK
ncbi:hypothetical protein KFE26_14945 [Shewanella sp. M16]|uniref:hypothetical protein n=1 Tax=Shewanella sp. M16 TaxID=2830837 RepID=UPI001BB0ABF9|nr:hypothetical protein [Shewanella sp. M16]MBS0043584.1 hypothetical protein [Shewanella sp. M16]